MNRALPWNPEIFQKIRPARSLACACASLFLVSAAVHAALASLGIHFLAIACANAMIGYACGYPLFCAFRLGSMPERAHGKARAFAASLRSDLRSKLLGAAARFHKLLRLFCSAPAKARHTKKMRELEYASSRLPRQTELLAQGFYGPLCAQGAFDLALGELKSARLHQALQIWRSHPFNPHSDASCALPGFLGFHELMLAHAPAGDNPPESDPAPLKALRRISFLELCRAIRSIHCETGVGFGWSVFASPVENNMSLMEAQCEKAALLCASRLPETCAPLRKARGI